MTKRLQTIYDEIEKLTDNSEDPNEWVGFINPSTYTEIRHPSNKGTVLGSTLFLGGLELRKNELVRKGEMILINRKLIHEES